MSTTEPTPGPFGPDTDEAVSALLDGELDAFAREHGTTEADALEQLTTWPAFDARRHELEAARAAVTTPLPPLDDVTRKRLVRNAVEAGPSAPADAPARRAAPWRVIGAVAASVIILVGIGLAVATSGDDGTTSQDSASSGSASSALRGEVGDLGDVTSPDALRALLDGGRDRAETSSGAGGTPAPSVAESAPPAADSLAREFDASLAPAIEPRACAEQLAGDRDVAFVGTGTFRGSPVTIVGLRERGRTIAFVVPSNDCTDVLASISR